MTTYIEIDETMTACTDDCCGECDLVFPDCMLDDDGECPACAKRTADALALEDAIESAESERDDAQSAVETLDSEIADLEEQLKEARHSRKAEARRLVKAEAKLATLEARREE